jgi:hemerythrin-like domain-containing protein
MSQNPIDLLEEENRYIARVVSAADRLADRLAANQPVEARTLKDVADFMLLYADKCHHGKEEDKLFPLLEKRGVPTHGCPLEALSHEYGIGRALAKGLTEAVAAYRRADRTATIRLINNLRGIAELYPNHIWKEDHLLFPISHKVLSTEDQYDLALEFESVEQMLGWEMLEHFEQLSEQLALTV